MTSLGLRQSGGRPATDTSFEGVEWDEFEMATADDPAPARSTPENLNKSRESAKSGATVHSTHDKSTTWSSARHFVPVVTK